MGRGIRRTPVNSRNKVSRISHQWFNARKINMHSEIIYSSKLLNELELLFQKTSLNLLFHLQATLMGTSRTWEAASYRMKSMPLLTSSSSPGPHQVMWSLTSLSIWESCSWRSQRLHMRLSACKVCALAHPEDGRAMLFLKKILNQHWST